MEVIAAAELLAEALEQTFAEERFEGFGNAHEKADGLAAEVLAERARAGDAGAGDGSEGFEGLRVLAGGVHGDAEAEAVADKNGGDGGLGFEPFVEEGGVVGGAKCVRWRRSFTMAGEVDQPAFADVAQRRGQRAQAFARLAPAVQPDQAQGAAGVGERFGAEGGVVVGEAGGLGHIFILARWR